MILITDIHSRFDEYSPTNIEYRMIEDYRIEDILPQSHASFPVK